MPHNRVLVGYHVKTALELVLLKKLSYRQYKHIYNRLRYLTKKYDFDIHSLWVQVYTCEPLYLYFYRSSISDFSLFTISLHYIQRY